MSIRGLKNISDTRTPNNPITRGAIPQKKQLPIGVTRGPYAGYNNYNEVSDDYELDNDMLDEDLDDYGYDMDDSDNDFNAHYPGHPQNPNKYGLHPPPHGHNPGLSSYSDDDLISDSYPPAPGPVRGVVGKRSPAQLPMGSRVAEAPLSSSGSLFGDAKAQPAAGLHFGDSSSSNADSDSDEEDIFDFNAMKKKTAKLEEKGREKELKELREKELKEQREKEEREKELKEQRERQEREKRDREQEQREKEEREMRDRQRKEIAEREKKDNKDKSREKERSKAISGFSGDLPSGFGDAKGGAFSESGKNDFSNFLRDNSMGGAGDLSGLEGFGKDLSQNKKRQSSIQSVADDESNEFDKQIDFDNGDSASENKGNFLLAGIDSEKVSRAKEESKNKIPSHQDSFEEDSSNDFLDPNSNKAPPESNIRHSNYSFQPGSNSPDIHRMIQGTYPLEHPAAREYVTEALLAEEKMKARDILNNQNIANDKLGVLLKKYNEISIENTRLQTQLQLRNSKDKGYLEENTELKQRLEKYRIENDALIETIDIKELKIQEILSTNRALEQESAQKSRLLKERQEFTSKSYFNTALDSQKRCFEAEIESRDLKIEMLEDALKSAEEKIMIFDAGSELNGTQNLRGAKLTNTDLNSKLVDLQAQLEKRDRLREVESPHDELEKELILGELLLKGVTKENEKLNLENKDLRAKFGFGGTHLTGQLGNTRNHLGAVSNDKDREYKESIIRLQEELQKKHEIIEAGIANLSLKEDIILEKNTSIENLHAQLSQAEEKNKSLITELNRIAFHKSRSPEDSRMIEDLKEKLNILDTQLNQIETENKDYKSHISSYGKESQAAKKEIKSLKKKNSDLQIKVKELETELKQQKDKYSQIRPVKKGPSSKKSKVSETLLGPNNKHIVADFKLNTITIDELDDSLDENFKRVGDLNPSSSQPANNENSSFNDKKQLVKTILHRMKSSDEYQRINDLFDNILVFATKGMLQEMKMPLYDLKSIIEEHPRLSDNYQLINYIDGIFNTLRVDKQGSDGVILDYLRKAENEFINHIYPQLPEILQRLQIVSEHQSAVYQNNFIPMKTTNIGRDTAVNPNEGKELKRLKQDIHNLELEVETLLDNKTKLEKIIRDNPRSTRDIDFCILERKLDMLEKDQRMRALDITQNIKTMMAGTSANFALTESPDSIKWKQEKEKLVAIIKTKNREISRFRQELDKLLLELAELKHK